MEIICHITSESFIDMTTNLLGEKFVTQQTCEVQYITYLLEKGSVIERKKCEELCGNILSRYCI